MVGPVVLVVVVLDPVAELAAELAVGLAVELAAELAAGRAAELAADVVASHACAVAQCIVPVSNRASRRRQSAVRAASVQTAPESSLSWRLRRRTAAAWRPSVEGWDQPLRESDQDSTDLSRSQKVELGWLM